jgi:L,D-transpeptidase ErfK/SrfK
MRHIINVTRNEIILMYNLIAAFSICLISLHTAGAAQASNVPADIATKIETTAETKPAQAAKPSAREKTQSVAVSSDAPLYKLDYIGNTEKYKAEYEDTLIHLARKNNLGFIEMRSANPHLDPWIPGEDAEIILPKRHLLPNAPKKGVVINLAEMRLYIFDDAGNAPTTFPIGVGREGLQTPIGSTSVTRKAIGPSWRPTARMRKEDPSLPDVIKAGPDNPLGTHAIYLGWPQYAIHGTNRPYGIGRRVSSGCIRMYPEAIVKAYDLIPKGTMVTVVDQTIKVGWVDDMLYIEASTGQELADEMERLGKVREEALSSNQISYIKTKAGKRAAEIDWDIAQKAYNARSGYPVPVLNKTKGKNKAEITIAEAELKSEEPVAPDSAETLPPQETNEDDTARIKEETQARVLNASYND